MTIMQGDSYPIYIELTQDGDVLVPEMISELEVCVGDKLRKTYSNGEVKFDKEKNQWYIHPTQEETLGLNPDSYPVYVRVRYKNTAMEEVVGLRVGRITVTDSISEAVI